jgi:protein transport protein SEC39
MQVGSLRAFPDTLDGSLDKDQLEHLITVTHYMGAYRLVFKQGEPFKPVSLRLHGDPISIIGKILDQNSRSYTKIGDFVDMGKHMVRAGLTVRRVDGETALKPEQVIEEESVAEKRVVSMCIDAALVEDDFETAYSYVVTRLKEIAGPAHARTPELERRGTGLFAEPPPKVIDDWSWRAALQAGKYRRTSQTTKPTHLGNASGNLEIRHLEQRMDCLAQALRIAPKATLQEILNVYRRCEEELESHVKQEAEQEEAWDAQGDEQVMPGGYAPTPAKKTTNSRAVEEAPMSLFDLSRASMARAQNGFSALSMLKGNHTVQEKAQNALRESIDSGGSTGDSSSQSTVKAPIRKRDQLKNAAVGSLASGIGWLINAPPINRNDEEHEDH